MNPLPASRAFFFGVHSWTFFIPSTPLGFFMTISTPSTSTVVSDLTPTRWADANAVTFTGRVFNAELVEGRYGEFIAMDVITRPVQDDDDSQVVLHFNSSALVNFFKAGGIPTGRAVTVTGNMTGIQATYTDKDGLIIPLKRARVLLGETICQWGAKPSKK